MSNAETQELVWYSPTVVKPQRVINIVVDYGCVSYSGVYNPKSGYVIRYPEDLAPVKLDDCRRWCHLPAFERP